MGIPTRRPAVGLVVAVSLVQGGVRLPGPSTGIRWVVSTAAERTGQPVGAICARLAARHGLEAADLAR